MLLGVICAVLLLVRELAILVHGLLKEPADAEAMLSEPRGWK